MAKYTIKQSIKAFIAEYYLLFMPYSDDSLKTGGLHERES
jgi:hypothetical protein